MGFSLTLICLICFCCVFCFIFRLGGGRGATAGHWEAHWSKNPARLQPMSTTLCNTGQAFGSSHAPCPPQPSGVTSTKTMNFSRIAYLATDLSGWEIVCRLNMEPKNGVAQQAPRHRDGFGDYVSIPAMLRGTCWAKWPETILKTP